MFEDIDDDDDGSSLTTLSEDDEPLEVVTDPLLVSKAAAVIKGHNKRALRKFTRVPRPKTTLLKPDVRNRKFSQTVMDKRLNVNVNHDLEFWTRKAPVYRLAGVCLRELQARTKNAPKDKRRAQEIMDEMKTWDSDGASGVFQDETGNTLVAYFGRRVDPEAKNCGLFDYSLYTPGPKTPSTMGRSPACLDKAQNEGKKMYSDGIKKQTLDKVLVATQLLVHHIGVERADRDGRHDKGDMMMKYSKDGGPPGGDLTTSDDRQSFVLDGVEYVYQDKTFTSETTGVIHLVHGWPDQAHDPRKDGIHPSKQMVSGARGAPHVHAYFQATKTLALRLAVMFRKSFPEFYYKYKKAFDAGKWTVVDPGPFLGRVIVWKLSVCPHQDGLDEGPAVIFPMGSFEGGECYIPDLKLKLSYRPGEVIILMAGALYHAIGDWTPHAGVSVEGVTPGRVSNVWFFPRSSYEFLQDKPANWSLERAGGTIHFDSHLT